MQQGELNFTLPRPADLTGLTPQEQKLYARLLEGAIRTDDIRGETALIHYSRRFTSIRRALAEHGWTILKRYCGNRIWEYFLERLQQINKQAAAGNIQIGEYKRKEIKKWKTM